MSSFQALKTPKICSCGATHHIAVNPRSDVTGVYWECGCKSTLFVPDETYREVQKARLNARIWVREAARELGLVALILLTMLTFTGIAAAQDYDSVYTQEALKNSSPGACLPESRFGHQIVSAIDEHHYEIVAFYGVTVVSRGLLETTKSSFDGPGRFNIKVRYLGAKMIPMENGFKKKFGLWRECE